LDIDTFAKHRTQSAIDSAYIQVRNIRALLAAPNLKSVMSTAYYYHKVDDESVTNHARPVNEVSTLFVLYGKTCGRLVLWIISAVIAGILVVGLYEWKFETSLYYGDSQRTKTTAQFGSYEGGFTSDLGKNAWRAKHDRFTTC
jgi:hypothetical protein